MRQPPFCGEGGETPFAGRRWRAALIGELSAKLTERLRGMRRGRQGPKNSTNEDVGRQAQKGGEMRCTAEPISYKSAV